MFRAGFVGRRLDSDLTFHLRKKQLGAFKHRLEQLLCDWKISLSRGHAQIALSECHERTIAGFGVSIDSTSAACRCSEIGQIEVHPPETGPLPLHPTAFRISLAKSRGSRSTLR